MITLIADEKVLILPNAELGDGLRPNSVVLLKRAMDSTVYTNVKTKTDKETYRFSVRLTRKKSIELVEFVFEHSAKIIRLQWRTLDIDVALRVNPVELELTTRAVVAGSVEETTIQLEFERL